MYVGFMLHVIQQFTGINIIMQFGPSILQDAGFGGGSHQALLLSMVFLSSVNALGNSLGVALSGKYGRREMMLKSTIPMGVALLIMASAMIASSLIGGDLLKECKSSILNLISVWLDLHCELISIPLHFYHRLCLPTLDRLFRDFPSKSHVNLNLP